MDKKIVFVHPLPSSFVLVKLRKLKQKYEKSLERRLNRREYLKKVICNWIHFKIFRSWRKWRSIKILPTSYENMKSALKQQISTFRHQLYSSTKKSRNHFFNQVAESARQQRSKSRNERRTLAEKKFEDFRTKSALARIIKKKISTASKNSREKLKIARKTSANEIRSFSRARMRENLTTRA